MRTNRDAAFRRRNHTSQSTVINMGPPMRIQLTRICVRASLRTIVFESRSYTRKNKTDQTGSLTPRPSLQLQVSRRRQSRQIAFGFEALFLATIATIFAEQRKPAVRFDSIHGAFIMEQLVASLACTPPPC